ncbi:MAG: phosphocholine cytidylyltransferase family protein [Alphaproteobacteria bacterium]|nr:phosphocholine cytidylyltransferase family protein [Alphaproteobacteria bacterium]
MKALILSAGQGSRLLPLTAETPKCLLPIGPLNLIEWQLQSLIACGVDEVVVVTGYGSDQVCETLARWQRPDFAIRTVFNPFFNVADNLASCWLARHEMDQDFLIINGDTLFEPDVLKTVLKSPTAPITITIDRKACYDSDDMKVEVDGDRLLAVGKALSAEVTNGESIGMLLFRDNGPALFADMLDQFMHTPEGLKTWYLRVIDRLAKTGAVKAASIEGRAWGEVDFIEDLERARQMVTSWSQHLPASDALALAAGS